MFNAFGQQPTKSAFPFFPQMPQQNVQQSPYQPQQKDMGMFRHSQRVNPDELMTPRGPGFGRGRGMYYNNAFGQRPMYQPSFQPAPMQQPMYKDPGASGGMGQMNDVNAALMARYGQQPYQHDQLTAMRQAATGGMFKG